MKYNAFISYRRDNGFLMAQVIYDRLKERGISCFLDLEELRSGKFDEKILSAIKDAEYFILILPKNALNRCINEGDWVRKEILAAVEFNKTIIPVMYDGFSWPKKWPANMPEEITNIERMNGVSASQEYLPAMIDKLISYMPDIRLCSSNIKETNTNSTVPLDTLDFFKYAINNINDISCIDMAFHAGADWRTFPDKIDILSYIIDKKIRLRILANSEIVVGKVVKSMARPLKRYIGFDLCLKEWGELMEDYSDTISVRIADVPLLHRLYIIKSENTGIVNAKYYTYGNTIHKNDLRLSFDFNSKEYALYTQEFDYLWEHAEEWNPQND